MSGQKKIQSKTTMVVAAIFLGVAGVHRYLMGYPNWWWMTITFGGLGVWTIVDIFRIAAGKMAMKDGRKLV